MSGWRMKARAVIRGVIAANPALVADPKAMLKAIDADYPFGERKYTPYKEWLEERRKAMTELALANGDRDPTLRPCPACGAKILRPCRDLEGTAIADARVILADAIEDGRQRLRVPLLRAMTVHAARLPAVELLPLFKDLQ